MDSRKVKMKSQILHKIFGIASVCQVVDYTMTNRNCFSIPVIVFAHFLS